MAIICRTKITIQHLVDNARKNSLFYRLFKKQSLALIGINKTLCNFSYSPNHLSILNFTFSLSCGYYLISKFFKEKGETL